MRIVEYQISYPLRMELVQIQIMFILHFVHGALHPPKAGKYQFVLIFSSISTNLHSCMSMQNRCEQDTEQYMCMVSTIHHAETPVPAETLSVVS